MRATLLFLLIALPHTIGCAGCDGFGDGPDDGRTSPNSQVPVFTTDGGDAGGQFGGADTDHPAEDAAVETDDGDPGTPDMPGPTDVGTADSGEPDADGTDAGDLASGAVCGDGILQLPEVCDDGTTTDCVGTHDGGDGSCVAIGACAAGYSLSAGACVANNTGLNEPCQNGPGFTLFRYHYSNNSTSAQLDVWDATCSYSFAPNSACNVYEICPGFCDPDLTADGYPVFDTSDYMRVRFSVNGLNFSKATLWVQARSYATSSSTNFRVWSPLYGEVLGGPVDNDFVYDWYSVDWTGYLYPADEPALTAIQLYGSTGRVAVKAVELCVE